MQRHGYGRDLARDIADRRLWRVRGSRSSDAPCHRRQSPPIATRSRRSVSRICRLLWTTATALANLDQGEEVAPSADAPLRRECTRVPGLTEAACSGQFARMLGGGCQSDALGQAARARPCHGLGRDRVCGCGARPLAPAANRIGFYGGSGTTQRSSRTSPSRSRLAIRRMQARPSSLSHSRIHRPLSTRDHLRTSASLTSERARPPDQSLSGSKSMRPRAPLRAPAAFQTEWRLRNLSSPNVLLTRVRSGACRQR